MANESSLHKRKKFQKMIKNFEKVHKYVIDFLV